MAGSVSEASGSSTRPEQASDQTRCRQAAERPRDAMITVTASSVNTNPLRATSISSDEAICDQCGEPMVPQMQHVIDVDSPLAEMPLIKLGIPDREILNLATAEQSLFVQLSPAAPSGA